MSKTELSELKLKQLTPEQRLKITQGIVDDLVRALNVGNYSLVWRYFSDQFSQEMGAAEFTSLHEKLINQYQKLSVLEQINSRLDDGQLFEHWHISTDSSQTLSMKLELTSVKEFLVIERLSIEKASGDTSKI